MSQTSNSLSDENTLTPFWRRLPRFFAYPLQLGAMLRIGGYTVAGLVVIFVMPLIGFLFVALLWIAFLKYAFVALEHTAQGHLDEPGANGSMLGEGSTLLVIKSFLLYLTFGFLIGLLAVGFGPGGLVAGTMLGSFLLPAAVMILALSGSLLEALNPLRMSALVQAMGSPYFGLCFFLMSLGEGAQWLQRFLWNHMEVWLALPLMTFVGLYFTLIIFHMMGYALYQYHEALGYRAKVSFQQAEAKQTRRAESDPVVSRLNTLMAEGNPDAAQELLEESLRTRWQDNGLHERYHKLLLATDKKEPALRHGREFIHKLLNDKRPGRALDVYEKCRSLDPGFQPQDPAHLLELARIAQTSNRPQLAFDLLRDFRRLCPEHPEVPSALLLAARILSEQMQRDRDAVFLLRHLLEKFPEHEAAAEAQEYLGVLAKFGAA